MSLVAAIMWIIADFIDLSCRPPPCYQNYVAAKAVQRLRNEGLPYSIRQLPEAVNPVPAAFSRPSMPDKPYQVSLTMHSVVTTSRRSTASRAGNAAMRKPSTSQAGDTFLGYCRPWHALMSQRSSTRWPCAQQFRVPAQICCSSSSTSSQ